MDPESRKAANMRMGLSPLFQILKLYGLKLMIIDASSYLPGCLTEIHFHFPDDRIGSPGWIAGVGNRSSDNNVGGARRDRLAGRGNTLLIIQGGSRRAHPWGDNSESFAQRLSYLCGF